MNEFCQNCDCLTVGININIIDKGDFYLCNDCVEICKAKTDNCKVFVCEGCDDYYTDMRQGENKEFCCECSPDYSSGHYEDCYESRVMKVGYQDI